MRSANVALLQSYGVTVDTMNQIPSSELQLIADAIRGSKSDTGSFTPQTGRAKLNKNASLATAMKAFGINSTTNAKGDTLLSYHANRPKYPFVYRSIRGARWKCTGEQAARRFH
jgi:hypothetical protein